MCTPCFPRINAFGFVPKPIFYESLKTLNRKNNQLLQGEIMVETFSTTLSKSKMKSLEIPYEKACECSGNRINCMTAKDWIKSQIGVWQFNYEKRDIRDKNIHPATFPISLSKKVIELFTHKGELIVDPFVGSGTTLVAAQDLQRNAIGFDLHEDYVKLAKSRLVHTRLFNNTKQLVIQDDARNIPNYLKENTVKLVWTSPPYANLLNRPRKNKSRRDRKNGQLGKIEQYSNDERDLGLLSNDEYTREMGDIFEKLLPFLKPKAHCVINVSDMWWENERITIHVSLINELRKRGYELRNIIIWDKTNIVNKVGIFGWPSNYITMGVTFEYLLDFWKPPEK
jgi:DNA modification methylase